MDDDSNRFLDKIFSDVSKKSAVSQIVIGTAAGWLTGFVTVRVGKVAALALGGGVVLLQLAHHQGYVRVNWDKLYRQVDKLADKVEKEATGQGPKLMDKVERYVDDKYEKAKDALNKHKRDARRWYHSFIGDDDGYVTDTHIFLASFAAGVSMGMMMA
ncbi:FUN14 domain-containing protein 1A [Bacillus rossius redtenbacheri]|uniref:FUN14 domain-containing protein 1A n=1 Tax=Bacillus rossius redtenbacheri TaxID=93214 RepID=UPI002FDEC39B